MNYRTYLSSDNRRRLRHSRTMRKLRHEALEPRQPMAADLGLVDDALRGQFFTVLQQRINDQVFLAEAPLVGSQLAGSGPGQFIAELGQALDSLQLDEHVSVAEVKTALATALVGKVDATGISHQTTDAGREIWFHVPIRFAASGTLAADLGLGSDSVIDLRLHNEDQVQVQLNVAYDLEFGVRELSPGVSQFVMATDNVNEIRIEVSATLANSFSGGIGRMGVFVADFASGPERSTFLGTYEIDISYPTGQGLLLPGAFDAIAVHGTLNGSAIIHLIANGYFSPENAGNVGDPLFNLRVVTQPKIQFAFQNVSTNDTIDADGQQASSLDPSPSISYDNSRLDLGRLFRDFIDPAFTNIRDALKPIKPAVDFLTDPMPVLGEFTDLTIVDAAEAAFRLLPSADKAVRLAQLAEVRNVISLMNRILDYQTPGTADLNDATRGMGSVSLEYRHLFGDDSPEIKQQRSARISQQVASGDFSFLAPTAVDQEPQAIAAFSAQFGHDIRFPLLTESETLIGLLYGIGSTDLFQVDFDFDFGFEYSQTVPVPSLLFLVNGEFRFVVDAHLDLGFGVDAQGMSDYISSLDFNNESTLADSLSHNQHYLERAFYVNDHNPNHVVDGSHVSRIARPTNEQPELTLKAAISLGGSLGPDFEAIRAKAGLLGRIEADLYLDLNDLPDTLPSTDWIDPFTPARPTLESDWTYDGKLRADEISQILDVDPASLVNASGELIVGVDGFAEFGIGSESIVDVRRTIAETPFFDFTIATPSDRDIIDRRSPSVTLGTVDANGTLSVHAGPTAEYRVGVVHTPVGSIDDENFIFRSLGESRDVAGQDIQVVYWFKDSLGIRRSHRQTFQGVSRVQIDGGTGNDHLAAHPSLNVPITLLGGIGDDVLVGGAQIDELRGGDGEDQLHAGIGNDLMFGDAGNDHLYGGWGDDIIRGGSGNDTLFGDDGNDTLRGDSGDDLVRAGNGNDMASGDDGIDRVYGEAGNDNVFGGTGTDWLHGDDVSNLITMTPIHNGRDQLFGDAGSDEIRGGWGADELWGGSDPDSLFGEGDSDLLHGELGNDILYGDALFDLVGGDDVLYGDSGHDIVHGGPGNDTLHGGDNDDLMYGEAGNDLLRGGNGQDTLYGDAVIDLFAGGADSLHGDADNDWLYGGFGDDTLRGGSHNDRLDGGLGNDRADFTDATAGVVVSLASGTATGGSGNDTLTGIVHITGSPFNDTLYGDLWSNSIFGGAGNDTIQGNMGNDQLVGGTGTDTTVYDDIMWPFSLSIDLATGVANAGLDVDTVLEFENVIGSPQNDLIRGNSSANVIWGRGGADTIYGRSGNDTIYGESGDDQLYGEDGNDNLLGGTGADRLYGQGGSDILRGNDAANNVDGFYDWLDGGSGSDTIHRVYKRTAYWDIWTLSTKYYWRLEDGIANAETLVDKYVN